MTETDLALSIDGDLLIGPDGDFQTVEDIDSFSQDIVFRLKTLAGNYKYFPSCGASLDNLIGLPNSQDTASLGESQIITALTNDGRVNPGSLSVSSYPLDEKSIMFEVYIDLLAQGARGQTLKVQGILDLEEGLIL